MLQAGTVLGGRYTVESLVARGGMGAVYCARDERLGRRVAIKVLRPDLAADAAARERFLREGQIAAQIVHPNVVRTFDAGDDPAGPYLVQEFLTGQTLDQLVPLPPERVAGILGSIAAALGEIHSRGYVHCDVKPQNILVRDNGTPVLLDFGIARAEGAATTTLIATPHYLAPERAQGAPPTAASDLYALGIVLFQAVTGHPPFDGSDIHAIIQQHISTAVPPLPGADPAARVLDRIIGRLTAKQPDDRYDSTEALRADLAAVERNALHEQPTITVPPGVPRSVAPRPTPGTTHRASSPPAPLPARRTLLQTWSAAPAWRRRRWLAAFLVPLLVLLLGYGLARARKPVGGAAPSPAATPAVVTPAVEVVTPTVGLVAVPGEVIGLQYDAAAQVLEARGLVAQLGEARLAPEAPGIVLASDPPAETALSPGSPVMLHVSAGPAESVAPPAGNGNGGDDDKGKGKGEGKDEDKGKGKKDDD